MLRTLCLISFWSFNYLDNHQDSISHLRSCIPLQCVASKSLDLGGRETSIGPPRHLLTLALLKTQGVLETLLPPSPQISSLAKWLSRLILSSSGRPFCSSFSPYMPPLTLQRCTNAVIECERYFGIVLVCAFRGIAQIVVVFSYSYGEFRSQ